MATRTTIGRLLLDQALPEDLRGPRVLDKQGIGDLFQRLAERGDAELYRETAKKLFDVGRDAIGSTGLVGFGPEHLRTPATAVASRMRLDRQINQILRNDSLSDDQKQARVVEATRAEQQRLAKEVLAEAEASGNPLALQVRSGARGNATQLKGLIAGDHLYSDAADRDIPIPVQRSRAEGLTPAEYWAGTYGGRKGLVGTKLSVAEGGYLNKRIVNAAHRLMAVAADDDQQNEDRGLPVDADDDGSLGSLLARGVAGYPRNTPITPKVLEAIRNAGVNRFLVRSPLVGGPESGVYSRDVGIREYGRLPDPGENVGIPAGQSVSEPLTQSALGSKHSGGVAGSGPRGLPLINQLIEVPSTFPGGAALAAADGRVTNVRPAPQGGYYVDVDGKEHYVDAGLPVSVKVGQAVEAGDPLSGGIANPDEVIRHKGIGEGRRVLLGQFMQALKDSGAASERRNVELVLRGLVDHVELTDEFGRHLPGDVLSYQRLERNWKPRQGAKSTPLTSAAGRYLERPVLHYTIGTRLRPSMLKELGEFGIKEVLTHDEEPPFRPKMVPASRQMPTDEDWLVRMLGGYQEKSLLSAVHRGDSSDTAGTSFVPALAEGTIGSTWPKNILKR